MLKFLDAKITSDRNGYALDVEVEVEEQVKDENNKFTKTGNKVKRWKNISYPGTIEAAILSYIRYRGREFVATEDEKTLNEFLKEMNAIEERIKEITKGV
jgi:hypothetical protein